MTIGDRISKLRKQKGYNRTEFAIKLNIPYTTLRNYETGTREPGHAFLIQAANLLEVSTDYLLGLTSIPKSASKEKISFYDLSNSETNHIKKYRALDEHGKKVVDWILDTEYENSQSTIKQADEDYEEPANIIQFHIPEYWEPVSAGEGAWNDGDPPEDLLLRKRPPRGASFVVRVTGDSMEPTFHPGDRLFIRSQDYLDDGQIGIFVMDNCMYVKELRRGQLISHNPAYDPIPLNESARCQGRVLGVCDESYFEK